MTCHHRDAWHITRCHALHAHADAALAEHTRLLNEGTPDEIAESRVVLRAAFDALDQHCGIVTAHYRNRTWAEDLASGELRMPAPAPREGMVWREEPYPHWVATEDVEDAPYLASLISGLFTDESVA